MTPRAAAPEIQRVDRMRRVRQDVEGPAAGPPPQVATSAVHAMLDEKRRGTLDEPAAMLGDFSPRAGVASRKGRAKFAA